MAIPQEYQLDHYPKISIITPNYNQGDFIERTIRSVLDQGYPNLEYIIIDGGSTDQSVDIIKKYEDKLNFWVSEPDKGMYDAINKGFAKSSGEIMGWINSDDIHQQNSLFKLAKLFTQHKHVNWLMGYPTLINETDEVTWEGQDAAVHNPLFFYLHNHMRGFSFIQQESTFWRRSLWEAAGNKIDMQYKLAGDFELWLRFFAHSKLYFTHKRLSAFRRREGQKSEDQSRYVQEANLAVANNEPQQRFGIKLMIFLLKSYRKIYKSLGLKKVYDSYEKQYFLGRPRWLDDAPRPEDKLN